MDWLILAKAFGLLLVFEGLWPFLSPDKWRETLTRLGQAGDSQIRFFALLSMAVGLLLLWCVH